MAGQTRVIVLNEVETQEKDGWKLCFQYCLWHMPGGTENGYRFIWRKEGRLKPQRGQARIPSLKIATDLMQKAKDEGWGEHVGD